MTERNLDQVCEGLVTHAEKLVIVCKAMKIGSYTAEKLEESIKEYKDLRKDENNRDIPR